MDVLENIRIGKYADPPYTARPSVPGLLEKRPLKMDDVELRDLPTVLAKYRREKEEYDKARENYSKRLSEIYDLLKSDIEDEFGTKRHHKADLLWNVAWDRGHSSGYAEVYNEYSTLVDLLDLPPK